MALVYVNVLHYVDIPGNLYNSNRAASLPYCFDTVFQVNILRVDLLLGGCVTHMVYCERCNFVVILGLCEAENGDKFIPRGANDEGQ